MFLGVEMVIAKSFARIHKENLINYGILPLVFDNKADYSLIGSDDILAIDNVRAQLEKGELTVRIANTDTSFQVRWKFQIMTSGC